MDRSCEKDILDSDEKVFGLIYLISCTSTNLCYVGQTISHRKNKKRYRPFGILGRFNDHVSEAVNNTKKKQCSFLNNAIRKYGKDVFTVQELEICPKADLNAREAHYIAEYKTLSPDGYNLTKGGKTTYIESYLDHSTIAAPKKRGGCTHRSDETKQKMSASLKEKALDAAFCKGRSDAATQQHLSVKLERFKGCTIDPKKADSYIRSKGDIVIVKIAEKSTQFASKHDTKEQKREKARAFIKLLSDATLSNCGKPVKPE